MLENLVPAPRATRVQYPVPARGAARAARALFSLFRIFCTILNSTHQLLSFLRIGTQAPTFAFFCTKTALPAKEVSQKMHFIFFAPPSLL